MSVCLCVRHQVEILHFTTAQKFQNVPEMSYRKSIEMGVPKKGDLRLNAHNTPTSSTKVLQTASMRIRTTCDWLL